MIIGITGAIVGRVNDVRSHPCGRFIWLADVDLGNGGPPVQIVFGGDLKLTGGELVAVAPPGSVATEERPDGSQERKKMRARRYRGRSSHGMLCSLDELGWITGGPDEVAILCDMTPGQSLDDLDPHRRAEVTLDWERAKAMEKVALEKKASQENRAALELGQAANSRLKSTSTQPASQRRQPSNAPGCIRLFINPWKMVYQLLAAGDIIGR